MRFDGDRVLTRDRFQEKLNTTHSKSESHLTKTNRKARRNLPPKKYRYIQMDR
jgi:hypothetical protein